MTEEEANRKEKEVADRLAKEESDRLERERSYRIARDKTEQRPEREARPQRYMRQIES